jgi:predicted amidophosphoribosyltransferase
VLQDLFDVVLPTACAGCEQPLARGRDRLCPACVDSAPRGVWPLALDGLDGAWGWAPYDQPAGAALRRGKYRPDPRTLEVLGSLLASASTALVGTYDLVVSVPRSWQALLASGLEPATLLATPVARAAALPVSRVLRRRYGPAQAAQPDDLRRLNVQGSFRSVVPVSRSRVLLVDDVVTTGATARACADALRAAGAHQIVLLAACSPHL